MALATGAGTTALLQLTWPQVDFGRKIINLAEGAANKQRARVPINERALAALQEAYDYRSCLNVI
ncbi:MAG: hypothetical protein JJ975_09705 [Bacteroidia bacterium]|nr:hypothetical protein [Bacteroidia bacterium]